MEKEKNIYKLNNKNMNLYEISKDIKQASEMVDEDWVITEEWLTLYDQSDLSLKDKAQNIAFVIQELWNKKDAIKKEAERLNWLLKSINKNEEKLKDYLSSNLQELSITKLETELFKMSFRKSESIEITDEESIDKQFIKEKITTTIDKTAIKKAIKDWLDVKGAELKVNSNLQIK